VRTSAIAAPLGREAEATEAVPAGGCIARGSGARFARLAVIVFSFVDRRAFSTRRHGHVARVAASGTRPVVPALAGVWGCSNPRGAA
jgi:hypothetical protein